MPATLEDLARMRASVTKTAVELMRQSQEDARSWSAWLLWRNEDAVQEAFPAEVDAIMVEAGRIVIGEVVAELDRRRCQKRRRIRAAGKDPRGRCGGRRSVSPAGGSLAGNHK